MKKFSYITILLIAVLLLSACKDETNDEAVVLPEERLEEYINYWQNEEFDEMYEMLTEETKATYSYEDFVERYQKIYQDLEIEDISISFTAPTRTEEPANNNDNDEQQEVEEVTETIPIRVSHQSVVGEIKFNADITLVEQNITVNEDETKNDWEIEWHPGLIFPELRNDGTIRLVKTPTIRGEIFDRNGLGLAVNDSVLEVGVDPGRFRDREDEVETIAELLNMSVTAVDKILNQAWVADGLFVPLKTISQHDEELISDLVSIPAVLTRSKTGRSYPYGESMAHLIGYIGTITEEELERVDQDKYTAHDVIGKRGVEQIFEDRLRGEDGVRLIVENENSKVGIAEKAPVLGEDIHLTIDAELQKMIYEAYDGKPGTTAAINPKTGETLALVSSPSFDPHEFAYGISQSHYNQLAEDPDQPMLNRFASTYSPGSAFKPLTAMLGMRTGQITHDDAIEIKGLTWSKEGWGNYRVRRVSESYSPVDLKDALIRSDNIYFAQKALDIGGPNFVSGLERLGFGSDNFDYPYPIRASSISNSGEMDRETLLADSAYGQGEILMSALHLASTYTPILNDGKMIQPIFETSEEKGQVFAEAIIDPENAQYLRTALRQTVTASNGTARGANINTIALSGKTGTAELKKSLDDEDAPQNGWFVAYPETHDYIIAMMIEGIQDTGSGYVVDTLTEIYDKLYQEE